MSSVYLHSICVYLRALCNGTLAGKKSKEIVLEKLITQLLFFLVDFGFKNILHIAQNLGTVENYIFYCYFFGAVDNEA